MNDPTTARIVVLALALIAVLCVAGVTVLAFTGRPAPDALLLTIGTTTGALAGVLAPKGTG